MNVTPRQVRRRALYVTAGSGAIAILVMLDWWQHWLLPEDRPYLALMIYWLFLGLAFSAGITAAAAACHLAIGRAFTAGMRAGQQHVDGPAQRERLRLVE